MADDPLDLSVGDAMTCAELALVHFAVRPTAVEFVGARENVVFRVVDGSGEVSALRIHRPGYHTLAELESELEWTAALRAAGVATPRPIATVDGRWYAAVPFGRSGGLRHVGMMEWVDGVGLDVAVREGDATRIHHRIGMLMATMHAHTATWSGGPAFTRHALDREGLVGDHPWWGRYWDLPEMSPADQRIVNDARERIAQVLDDFGTSPDRFGLIHADLLPENVLVRGETPFVIDFDDAGFGWHLYDVATSLVSRVESADFERCCDALVTGYRSVRPLPDEHLLLLPVFLLARMMMQLGWMNSRVDESITFGPGRTVSRADLIEPRIERVVRWSTRVFGE
jgi:Ser/Thr protein kinase RdoA (MazF antagonist)